MEGDNEICERCTRAVDILMALENRGKIYKWVCERCYFSTLNSRKKKEQGKKELND